MIRVLLVIRSYFDAQYIAGLMDWDAHGYQLIMELNAISGLRRLPDLQPDVLLLHHDVGWLDANQYLERIHRSHLPTQIILLLGERGSQALEKRLFQLDSDIQVVEAHQLSAAALERALRSAVDYARAAEAEDVHSAQQGIPAADRLRSFSRTMRADAVCMMRLVPAKRQQPYSIRRRMEKALLTLLHDVQEQCWFCDETGVYCFLISPPPDLPAYGRIAWLNDTAQQLLRSVKQILLGDAFLSVCYAARSGELEARYAQLQQLETYRYFCQEQSLLSSYSVVPPDAPLRREALDRPLKDIWDGVVRVNPRKTLDRLQELFLLTLKPAMSFPCLEYAREALQSVCRTACRLCWRTARPDPAAPTARAASIETELENWRVTLGQLLQQAEAENADRSPLVRAALQRILTEFAGPLSLNQIADELGVSPAYLSRLYKAQMGMRMVDTLREIRMTAARTLLQGGCNDIRRVAEQVGYADSKYFSRTFQQQFRQTPSEFARGRAAGKGDGE